jgi:hypothetical protein
MTTLEVADPPRSALSMTLNLSATRTVNVAKGFVLDVVVTTEEAHIDLLRTLADLISMPSREL